jgi:hypothetical protein
MSKSSSPCKKATIGLFWTFCLSEEDGWGKKLLTKAAATKDAKKRVEED